MKRDPITVEADGQTYALRFSTNAMARYQDRAGEKVTAAFRAIDEDSGAQDLDIVRLRRLIWAALTPDSPDITEDQAGEVMDAVGVQAIAEKLGEAVRAAFPEASSGNVRTPPKKKAATG